MSRANRMKVRGANHWQNDSGNQIMTEMVKWFRVVMGGDAKSIP